MAIGRDGGKQKRAERQSFRFLKFYAIEGWTGATSAVIEPLTSTAQRAG
ncbi:hypothetical protein [Phyllobacterium phragmitis]|nr:hypothetical protein [Mesorhizobium sp. RMAD-H1]